MERTRATSPVLKVWEAKRVLCMLVTVMILVTSRTFSIGESGWEAGPYRIRVSELTSRQRASTGTRQRTILFPHPRSSTYRERETKTLRRYVRWVHVTASLY